MLTTISGAVSDTWYSACITNNFLEDRFALHWDSTRVENYRIHNYVNESHFFQDCKPAKDTGQRWWKSDGNLILLLSYANVWICAMQLNLHWDEHEWNGPKDFSKRTVIMQLKGLGHFPPPEHFLLWLFSRRKMQITFPKKSWTDETIFFK